MCPASIVGFQEWETRHDEMSRQIRQARKHPTIAQNANVICGCVERSEHIPNGDEGSVHISTAEIIELPNSPQNSARML